MHYFKFTLFYVTAVFFILMDPTIGVIYVIGMGVVWFLNNSD